MEVPSPSTQFGGITLNDMCLLAPSTLIDPSIAWEAVDATTARARFTYKDQMIAAPSDTAVCHHR